MNFSWLQDFLALAATGNFSRAAQERHMTQPAFSRRVRALEEWLGAELFDRSSQPARLTAAGEWFKGVAEGLLEQTARLPGEARAVAQQSAGTLRFAATHALSFTFLPGWLRELETRTDIGAIQLMSDVMTRCEALLLERKVDFLLVHSHPGVASRLAGAGCASVQVGADVLLPVAAASDTGQPVHSLGPAASRGTPVLAYSSESGLGAILREVLGARLDAAGVRSGVTAHLASVLKTMALDGRGIAWLPHSLVAGELADGRLVAAAPEDWRIELEIRLYRHDALGGAAERFWEAAAAGA